MIGVHKVRFIFSFTYMSVVFYFNVILVICLVIYSFFELFHIICIFLRNKAYIIIFDFCKQYLYKNVKFLFFARNGKKRTKFKINVFKAIYFSAESKAFIEIFIFRISCE